MLCKPTTAPTRPQALLAKYQRPLFGVESRRPLSEFDVLGFSLSYELGGTNILEMLRQAGVPGSWEVGWCRKFFLPVCFCEGSPCCVSTCMSAAVHSNPARRSPLCILLLVLLLPTPCRSGRRRLASRGTLPPALRPSSLQAGPPPPQTPVRCAATPGRSCALACLQRTPGSRVINYLLLSASSPTSSPTRPIKLNLSFPHLPAPSPTHPLTRRRPTCPCCRALFFHV